MIPPTFLRWCLVVLAALIAASSRAAESRNLDEAVSLLGEKLATSIQKSGVKKVTVLDFGDLQNRPTDFGRLVAEQLSVALVERRNGFSMIDRANLKTILAQHKLTLEGLTEPENAKALGKFSGVDAIVLGTVAPYEDSVSITAKIIATETAEIVGAAKAQLPKGKDNGFLSASTSQNSSPPTAQEPPKFELPKKPYQQIGDLIVIVDGLRKIDQSYISASLTFQNTSSTKTIAVGLYTSHWLNNVLKASLIGSTGEEFQCLSQDVTGVRPIRYDPRQLTEIPPRGEVKASLKFSPHSSPASPTTSFRFQAEVMLNKNYSESAYVNYSLHSSVPTTDEDVVPSGCKVHNVVLDITM